MEYKKVEELFQRKLSTHKSKIDEDALLANLGLEEYSESKRWLWKYATLLVFVTVLLSALYCGYLKINNGIHSNQTIEGEDIIPEVYVRQDNIVKKVNDTNRHDRNIANLKSPEINNEIREGRFTSELEIDSYGNNDAKKVSTNKYIQNESLPYHNNLNSMVGDKTFFSSGKSVDRPVLNSVVRGGRNLETVFELKKEVNLLKFESNSVPLIQKKIMCPTFDNKKFWYQLGLDLGVGKLHNRWRIKEDQVTEYQLKRKDAEKSLECINARLFASINSVKIPVGIKLGLGIERYANRMRLTTEYTEQDTTVGIISSTVSASGDTITHIYGDIITEKSRFIDKQRHYYLYNLTVPVGVNYNYDFGGLSLQAEVGAEFNLVSWKEGEVLSSIDDFVPVSDDDILTGFGTSFYAQINLTKPIKNGISIYVAPYLKYGFQNFSAKSGLDHRFHSEGIKVGVLRYF